MSLITQWRGYVSRFLNVPHFIHRLSIFRNILRRQNWTGKLALVLSHAWNSPIITEYQLPAHLRHYLSQKKKLCDESTRLKTSVLCIVGAASLSESGSRSRTQWWATERHYYVQPTDGRIRSRTPSNHSSAYSYSVVTWHTGKRFDMVLVTKWAMQCTQSDDVSRSASKSSYATTRWPRHWPITTLDHHSLSNHRTAERGRSQPYAQSTPSVRPTWLDLQYLSTHISVLFISFFCQHKPPVQPFLLLLRAGYEVLWSVCNVCLFFHSHNSKKNHTSELHQIYCARSCARSSPDGVAIRYPVLWMASFL